MKINWITFMDTTFPWMIVVIGSLAMIYLTIGGINDRLDINKTCSQINL